MTAMIQWARKVFTLWDSPSFWRGVARRLELQYNTCLPMTFKTRQKYKRLNRISHVRAVLRKQKNQKNGYIQPIFNSLGKQGAAMTVRLTSFSSGSASVSTSAHTGDEYFVPGTGDDHLFTGFGGEADRDIHATAGASQASRCATEATDCTEATWKEQAHWLSFRDSVHRIQNQLASNGGINGRRTACSGGRGLKLSSKNKNGTFSRKNLSSRHRPPKAPLQLGNQRVRPPLHHAVNNALRSPSPQEIERDLQLYRHEDEQTSPMAGRRRGRKGDLDYKHTGRSAHLSNCTTTTESPTRDSSTTSYHRAAVFRDCAGSSRLGEIKAIPESEEEVSDDEDYDIIEPHGSSEDSLDDLVQSLLPSNTGGLADPPTGFHLLNIDAEVTDDIPKSVDADPNNGLLVEPSPLRPHHHQEDDDDDEDDETKLEDINKGPINRGALEGNAISSSSMGARATLIEGVDRGQPPSRSSSPHPSIHSEHSSSSYSRSHSSYSTGASSSYGSSFDPELLAEETRQRALESHLAEAQLKLALVEAERDEMEFELLQRKRKG